MWPSPQQMCLWRKAAALTFRVYLLGELAELMMLGEMSQLLCSLMLPVVLGSSGETAGAVFGERSLMLPPVLGLGELVGLSQLGEMMLLVCSLIQLMCSLKLQVVLRLSLVRRHLVKELAALQLNELLARAGLAMEWTLRAVQQ